MLGGALALGAAQASDPPKLPEITAEGAAINLAGWEHRKALTSGSGVCSIALDPGGAGPFPSSTSRGSPLGAEGKATPLHRIELKPRTKSLSHTIASEQYNTLRAVSIWRITLPIAGLTSTHITASSSTVLFERSFSAWSLMKDFSGEPVRTSLGSANWSHHASGSDPDLELTFHNRRLPESFFLETDNGDNPPLSLDNVTLHYPEVHLIAKLTEDAPILLYYGNANAMEPRYDLRLIRQELVSAQQQILTLGAQENLAATPKKRVLEPSPLPTTGALWLWAALALVIVGLLWVVAKMLPKEPPPPA